MFFPGQVDSVTVETKTKSTQNQPKSQITRGLEVKECRGEVKFYQKSSWAKPYKREEQNNSFFSHIENRI